MNVWENWGNERKFNPKLKENEHADLDKKLQMFYAEVLTKDGLEYEPESLKSMLAALHRHLKEHDYKYSTARDHGSYQSMFVLEGKVKHLHQRGNWKRPNAASTDKRRRRRNTLDGKNSRRFQSRSSFSHDVVESN